MLAALQDIEDKLSARGYKLTKNRRLLLQGIMESNDWTTAQELFNYVYNRNNKINFSTIYRNLEMLTVMGLVCQVNRNAVSYYTLNHEDRHHHHLICKSCNKVFTLNFCPLNSLDPGELQNFSEIECKFEVYGLCQECQARNPGFHSSR